MKLFLNQSDLVQAIQKHVSGLIQLAPGAKMELTLKGDGVEIDINYLDVQGLAGIQASNGAKPPQTSQEPATAPAAITVATEAAKPAEEAPKKLDGRSKEAREQKKKGLFARDEESTSPNIPVDDEPVPQGGEFEPVEAALPEETQEEVEAAEEAPPPPPEKPRKSLFGG